MLPLRKFPFDREILLVAHRGASGDAPENTFAAFELAIAQGAKMIELDVQRTADDRLVVIHDSTLRRTTNSRGRVAKFTYTALRSLDAGSWFGKRFAGEPIPLLDDVLDRVRGRLYINIEVKSTAVRDGTAGLLIRAIHRHRMEEMVLVSSFHHGVVKQIKAAAPMLATAVIAHPTKPLASISAAARRAHADTVVCSLHQLTKRRVREAKAHGFPLTVYTVNTPAALKKVLRYGVGIVVTNYPARIGALIVSHPKDC